MKQPVHPIGARGFSLLELMVALTISLLLMAGVIGVVTTSSTRYGELAQTGRQVENGRYAIELLKNDIRHAGFWGEWVRMDKVASLPTSPCTTLLDTLRTELPPVSLQGYVSTALTCLAGAPVAGSDILVVRRTHTETLQTSGGGNASDYFLHTNARVAQLEPGGTVLPTFSNGTSPRGVRRYLTRFYYVRPCSRCEGGGDGIPTLWRTELVRGAWQSEPLVEGIENLQIEYGIDRDGQGRPSESNPGTSKDAFVSRAAADTGGLWPQVVAARIHVLARNLEASAHYTDEKTYRLGGITVGPFKDNIRRHVYSVTTRMMNTYWESSS